MSNKHQIKNVEIFCFDDGTESADVRVQFGDAEFSIQLGTDGRWSFAPEADVTHGAIGRFVAEYPNSNDAAAGLAALVDALQAIESAAAVGITDVVRLGIIPAGVRLSEALAIISDGSAADVTYKLGFAESFGVHNTSKILPIPEGWAGVPLE